MSSAPSSINCYVRVVIIVVIILNGMEASLQWWFANPLEWSRLLKLVLGAAGLALLAFEGLEFVAMVVGREDELSGFFVHEDSLQGDESFFEGLDSSWLGAASDSS